jgi:subtilisin family serine protease
VDFAHQKDTMERIAAPQAWSRETGSRGVVVAVVDTGIDLQHPDLHKNLLRDLEGEVVGWNFLSGTPDSDDDHWHGTYCAGLIGAVGEDGTGMTGVNWRVSLMPVKAFSAAGFATSTHAAAGIAFAADHGADVILCAWGTPGDSDEIADAIAYADTRGALVVAAAGNSPVALDTAPHYPASFAPKAPNLISVSASSVEDRPLDEAAFSPKRVHLSAPGEGVYSTFPTRLQPYLPYHVSGGTSAAAALVAGACALLKAHVDSAQLGCGHREIRQAILQGVDKPHDLAGRSETEGRLNLDKALSELVRLGERAAKAGTSGPSKPQPLRPRRPAVKAKGKAGKRPGK